MYEQQQAEKPITSILLLVGLVSLMSINSLGLKQPSYAQKSTETHQIANVASQSLYSANF